jgi:hypothetical protein
MPYPDTGLNHANCGGELVSAPTQSSQLSTGGAKPGRLVKPHIAADEDLVRSDDESSMMALGYSLGFEFGKLEGAIDRRSARSPESVFDRLFVDRCRFDLEFKTRRCE